MNQVLMRCRGQQIDDTCDDILVRNPEASSGVYQLSGAATDGVRQMQCDFTQWTKFVTYGPEIYDGSLKPNLEMKNFPTTATQILVVNNGLTKIVLDDTNYGSGFNLNFMCFEIKDSNGNNQCKHFDKIGDTYNPGSTPENWSTWDESLINILSYNPENCIVGGGGYPNFCVDTFILQLDGNFFRGFSDKASATGQQGDTFIYDFSLYYA